MKRLWFIVIGLFLISCNGNQIKEETTSDTLDVADTVSSAPVKDSVEVFNKDFSYLEIIKNLPEQEKDLDLSEAYFDNYSAIVESKKTMKGMVCSRSMLPDSIICTDSIYFCWKITMQEYTLVNLMTMDWNAKGPSILYHLITVNNKNGKIMDVMAEWAASYSFAVENPEGGTSAGVGYTTASLQTNPALMVSTKPMDSKDTFSFGISEEGYFVDPYAMFEAEKKLQ